MSDNPLVDEDADITVDNYTRNSPTVGGYQIAGVTEGYGKDADRVKNPFAEDKEETVPYTGWANGINEVGDASTFVNGIRDTADDLEAFLEGKGWFNPAGILEMIAGGIGIAADVEGWATDPIGALTADAVQWLIEHVTVLRMAMDGLRVTPTRSRVTRARGATSRNG